MIGLVLVMAAMYACIFYKNFSFIVPGARNLISYQVHGGRVYYAVTGYGTWQEIDGVDIRSFEVISDNYIADKNWVYYCSETDGCHQLSQDIKGFSLIDLQTAKDSASLYYNGVFVGNISGEIRNFEENGQEYFIDSQSVWLKMVDPLSCQTTLSLLDGLDFNQLQWLTMTTRYLLISDDHDLFYIYKSGACNGQYFDSWQRVKFMATEATLKILEDQDGNFRALLKNSQDAIFSGGKLKIGLVPPSVRNSALKSEGEVVTWK